VAAAAAPSSTVYTTPAERGGCELGWPVVGAAVVGAAVVGAGVEGAHVGVGSQVAFQSPAPTPVSVA
jgi:hypothetical protein